jgi:hypothetical protein
MNKRLVTPLIIVAVLAVIAIIVLQGPGEYSRSDPGGNLLVEFDSAAVDRIDIIRPDGTVILEKIAGKWRITSPIEFAATDYMVDRLIEVGRSIRVISLVSSNPEKQELFAVDTSATLVRFLGAGKDLASVRIGKMTTSFTDTYVRLEGSDDVYIAAGMLSGTLDRKPEEWRDKGVFRAPRESISEIRYTYGDTTFTVSGDTVWTVDGLPIGEPTSLLASLAKFEATGILDSVLTEVPPLGATVEVNGVTIRFHKDPGEERYFVRSSAEPHWYIVAMWKAKQVLKRKDEFLAMKKPA